MGVNIVFQQHRHSVHGTPFFAVLQLLVQLSGYGQRIRIDLNDCVKSRATVIDCFNAVKVGLHHLGNCEVAVVIALLKLCYGVFFKAEFSRGFLLFWFLIAGKYRYQDQRGQDWDEFFHGVLILIL